jgi:subtilisin family serine protease
LSKGSALLYTQYIMQKRNSIFTLLCFLFCAPLFSAVHAQTTEKNSNIIPNEFIVKFKPLADPRLHKQNPDVIELQSVEDDAGVVSTKALSSLDHTYIYHTNGTLNRQATLQAFDNADAVESIEPDRLLSLLDLPNDPDLNKQWSLNKISANGAWDQGHGSDQVIVAVIDSGCDATHPDLTDNITETKIFDDPQFISDHGTHVCGIIGGVGNNAIGISGVNWNIGIMALKADAIVNGQHGLRMSKVADAISYATQHGARVINLSLGGTASDVLKNAIDEAEQQGVLVIAAAGNNASQNYNLYPAAWHQDLHQRERCNGP